jgi:hypothetical protein
MPILSWSPSAARQRTLSDEIVMPDLASPPPTSDSFPPMTDPRPQSEAPTAPALQFDRAVHTAGSTTAGVTCSQCGRAVTESYYTLSRKTFCRSCKAAVERAAAATRTPKAFARALAFGVGAAIAGATVYYAVLALLDLEIGIVAILIGYMVGYAIRKAVPGGGGRRYQILGGVLTYLAVGLAYLPVAIHGSTKGAAADSSHVASRDTGPATPNGTVATAAATADSSLARPTQVARDSVKAAGGSKSFMLGIGALVLIALALPVMVIIGSMPSGLISALIIGFGIRQAWRMTAAPDLTFVGPLRVAPPAAAAESALA